MRWLIYLFVLGSLPFSCAGPRNSELAEQRRERAATDRNSTEVDLSRGTDLTEFISRLPGVVVRGAGGGASINIRGVNSIMASTAPLYVLDEVIIGRDYAQLYNSVDIQQVKRINVLKDAADTAMYGVQGSNGVIVVEMKK